MINVTQDQVTDECMTDMPWLMNVFMKKWAMCLAVERTRPEPRFGVNQIVERKCTASWNPTREEVTTTLDNLQCGILSTCFVLLHPSYV